VGAGFAGVAVPEEVRVLLMPSNVDGNGYYRCLFPGKQLARLGHEVGWVPHQVQNGGSGYSVKIHYQLVQNGQLIDIPTVLINMDFDVLFMGQREEPWIGGLVRALVNQGKRVVVDSDDDWLSAGKVGKGGLKVAGYNPGANKPREAVDAMLGQLRAASALTVSTPALAELYGEFNDNITVVRNGLDWPMWADAQVPKTEKLRVGWMGDLQWRRGDLDVLRGVIGPWLTLNPHVEFVAAGDPEVHDYLAIPDGQRVSVAPTPFHCFDLPDITAVFDIGLVPLARNPLNEGKSHLKGLEYGACGIPYVASPSESYRWFTDGNGLLASTAAEWRQALDVLAADPLLRASMGKRGRELAEQTSVQERAHEWEAAVVESGVRSDAMVAA
jgi:hypothetical protein